MLKVTGDSDGPSPSTAALGSADKSGEMISPVNHGFTAGQVAGFHAGWQWRDILKTSEVSRYMFLHFSEFFPSAIVHRTGPVVALAKMPDVRMGNIRLDSSHSVSLDEYLAGPVSQAQGMIVVHRGVIIFERYPAMREDDYHITMSVAKTMPSLVIGLLEEEDAIDVQCTVGSYNSALQDSAWNAVKVIDVLNMASGLDVEETEITRDDPNSLFGRFLRSVLNVANADGKIEKHGDVICSAKKLREPGQLFEYSSINTQVLAMLAEAVTNQPWPAIFQQRVWSKLHAEGDMHVCLTPNGMAMPFGFVSMRLRDLARFGMLFTPAWSRAARQPVVTGKIIGDIRTGVSPRDRPDVPPANNSAYRARHWDWATADALFKGGLHGQGLYVSPEKDLVIAWFSTAPSTELPNYALAIAASPSLG